MRGRFVRAVVLVVIALHVVSAGGPLAADAQEANGAAAPTLILAETVADPGQSVIVSFAGWQGQHLTLAVCSDLAKRGAEDCNMRASESVRIYHPDGSPTAAFTISEPPGACPCVVRATSDAGEVADALIEIRGAAVGPGADSPSTAVPFVVAVIARPVLGGVVDDLRHALGGARTYEVTVTLLNATTQTLPSAQVHGAVGHDGSSPLREFGLQTDAISAGESWTGNALVTLPAPTFGSYTWIATVSGAGSVTTGSTRTQVFPLLLVVLVALLVGLVVTIAVRAVKGRLARKAAAAPHGSSGEGPDWSGLPSPPSAAAQPPSELVDVEPG